MEPDRVSEEDVERLRNMPGMRPVRVSNLAHLHQSRAAQYARTDENWLSLASTTSFEVDQPRAQESSQQTETEETCEAQQPASTNEPDPTMESIHSLCSPIPRAMRSGHRRTPAISKRSYSPINRNRGNLIPPLQPQLYFPGGAVPEHDPFIEPLPGFPLSCDPALLPYPSCPPMIQDTGGVTTQGDQQQQQEERQGRQGRPPQYPSEVSGLTADFQRVRTSPEVQDEDKNGLVGSLEKMDIQ